MWSQITKYTIHAKSSAIKDYPEIRLIDGDMLVNMYLFTRWDFLEEAMDQEGKSIWTYPFSKTRSLAMEARGKTGNIRVCKDRMDTLLFL